MLSKCRLFLASARLRACDAWRWIRFGNVTERITDTAGAGIPAEIEYVGRGGKVVGFWAYGYFDTSYPYKGTGIKTKRGYDELPF